VGADPGIPAEERIKRAMGYASDFGYTDGAHHKQWVIDQMARALTGCPMVTETRRAPGGIYSYEVQGESAEYREWAASEEGHEPWDEGIAP